MTATPYNLHQFFFARPVLRELTRKELEQMAEMYQAMLRGEKIGDTFGVDFYEHPELAKVALSSPLAPRTWQDEQGMFLDRDRASTVEEIQQRIGLRVGKDGAFVKYSETVVNSKDNAQVRAEVARRNRWLGGEHTEKTVERYDSSRLCGANYRWAVSNGLHVSSTLNQDLTLKSDTCASKSDTGVESARLPLNVYRFFEVLEPSYKLPKTSGGEGIPYVTATVYLSRSTDGTWMMRAVGKGKKPKQLDLGKNMRNSKYKTGDKKYGVPVEHLTWEDALEHCNLSARAAEKEMNEADDEHVQAKIDAYYLWIIKGHVCRLAAGTKSNSRVPTEKLLYDSDNDLASLPQKHPEGGLLLSSTQMSAVENLTSQQQEPEEDENPVVNFEPVELEDDKEGEPVVEGAEVHTHLTATEPVQEVSSDDEEAPAEVKWCDPEDTTLYYTLPIEMGDSAASKEGVQKMLDVLRP
jgi:hypothetical protein